MRILKKIYHEPHERHEHYDENLEENYIRRVV